MKKKTLPRNMFHCPIGREQTETKHKTNILFYTLKTSTFVVLMLFAQTIFTQTIFNNQIILPSTPIVPPFPQVLTSDPLGLIFRSPYFPVPSGSALNPFQGTLLWDGVSSWTYNTEFRKLPAGNAVIAPIINSFPTYYFSQTAPTTTNISILADGNIGTNHSTTAFGTFGSGAKWNALGQRPTSTTPYIGFSGLRSTWDDFGFNVALAPSYTSSIKDALLCWQDNVAATPTGARNRLVFGVRDASTTTFQELGQFASNGSFGIGLNTALLFPTFTLTQKLELYDFNSNPLYQRWRTNTTSNGSRIGLNGVNDNFEIRNDVPNAFPNIPNIEFWTNNNPQVYINEQPGGTPFMGVGTDGPLSPAVLFGADPFTSPGIGWSIGAPTAIPLFSVNGDISTTGNYYGNNIYIASDERLKQDITKLADWKRIINIQPYTYKFKEQKHDAFSYGFLAQDVYKTLPELTSGWGEALSVNYIGFIPFLAQGLKEHEERFNEIASKKLQTEELGLRIKKMENDIEAIKMQNIPFVENAIEPENALRINQLETENDQLKKRLEDLEQKFNTVCNLPCLQNNQVPKSNEERSGFGQTGTLGERPSLEQNEPNPFTVSTVIKYFLPVGSANAKIEVKNSEGKIVGSFPISKLGNGNITLASGTLAAGTYYYSLMISSKIVDTKKMILLN